MFSKLFELNRKKTYFISDAHLGVDAKQSSKEREEKMVSWLDSIKDNARAIYFLGDIFDHWFEYKNVIPKGFMHLIGKLVELKRLEIEVYFFTGNHDMWMFDFFESELNIPIYRHPQKIEIEGKNFHLEHGDALPNSKFADKAMKVLFSSPFLQWSFARLHPNFAIGIMKFFSKRSRMAHESYDKEFHHKDEYMIDYAELLSEKDANIDFIIMGHRHLPIDFTLKNGSCRYLNLGDWINYFSYAVFDGQELKIEFFEDEHPIYPN